MTTTGFESLDVAAELWDAWGSEISGRPLCPITEGGLGEKDRRKKPAPKRFIGKPDKQAPSNKRRSKN